MMGIQLFKEKAKAFLALDIGNEAVKALIFRKDNKKIIILGSSLQYFDRFGVFDSRDFEIDILKKTILKAVKEVSPEFGHAMSKMFDSVFIGLPANIFKGKIVFQNLERKGAREAGGRWVGWSPKKIIDKKEEETIYQTVLKDGQKKISEIFAQKAGILSREIQLVKAEILETKIDGYPVPGLPGFDGKELEFRILFTFFPKYYLENFKKITQILNLKILNIYHEVQNLIAAFEKPNAIFLDVGGEVSQIFLVNKGKLESVETFDVGGRAFSQILSQSFGLPEQKARVLKERYSKGELSEEVRERIKEIFAQEVQTWSRDLKLKLKEIKTLLPPTIFLFGGGSLLPEIQEILSEGDWGNLPFIKKPEIKFIFPKDLKNIADYYPPTTLLPTTTRPKKETIIQVLNNPQYTPTLLLCYHA